nr:ribosomal protein L9 [Porphyrostromium japonicum]
MTQKNISVLLLKDVDKLGSRGTINSVAVGYARNFLIPKGLACITTQGITQAVQRDLTRKQAIEEANIAKYREIANIIEGIQTFTIKKKVGKDNLIFGSVTNQEVSDFLENTIKQPVDKKNVSVPAIKTVGVYQVSIKLYNSINATINLQVVGEDE